MKKRSVFVLSSLVAIILFACTNQKEATESGPEYIRVSKENPRYFETESGKTWIPVMINFIMPNGDEEVVFKRVENYFKHFSENGGDAMRIWISSPFLEIEDTRQGEYNPVKFQRIDSLLGLAEKYKIRIKFTLQHVRSITPDGEGVTSWSNRAVLSNKNGGTFENIKQYINSPEGRKNYLDRARALSERYKDSRYIFSWELWNEMDAVDSEDWYPFSEEILDSVQVLFPNHLVAQTLGSMHSEDADRRYDKLVTLDNNDYITVHRYLDPGTDWEQYDHVHGPIDLLISQSIQFMYRDSVVLPVVPNEHGAVEGNHAGPNKLYPIDSIGVFIHDMIFTPFFCGASGCGSMWHWDSYVEKQNLWYHYSRFNSAVKGIDPVKERFTPFTVENDSVRFYGISGEKTTMVWCRDAKSNWMTELRDGIAPEIRKEVVLNLIGTDLKEYANAKIYDPWNDSWSTVAVDKGRVTLPPFIRSLVVVLQ